MSVITRQQVVTTLREVRRDRRREAWMLPQALLALAIVGGVVWIRESFFV